MKPLLDAVDFYFLVNPCHTREGGYPGMLLSGFPSSRE
jgi:hypothetical protein